LAPAPTPKPQLPALFLRQHKSIKGAKDVYRTCEI
jgi:hypothetical protein